MATKRMTVNEIGEWDNSDDQGRVYEISCHAYIVGGCTLENMQNGTVMKEGVRKATFFIGASGDSFTFVPGMQTGERNDVMDAVCAFKCGIEDAIGGQ